MIVERQKQGLFQGWSGRPRVPHSESIRSYRKKKMKKKSRFERGFQGVGTGSFVSYLRNDNDNKAEVWAQKMQSRRMSERK